MTKQRRYRVGAVHALMNAIPTTQMAFDRNWSSADVAHLLDGSLYLDRSRGTADDAELASRIVRLVQYSASTGAEGIIVTGSFFGEAARQAREGMRIPVATSFEGIIERALELDRPLHVLATAPDYSSRSTSGLRPRLRAPRSGHRCARRVPAPRCRNWSRRRPRRARSARARSIRLRPLTISTPA